MMSLQYKLSTVFITNLFLFFSSCAINQDDEKNQFKLMPAVSEKKFKQGYYNHNIEKIRYAYSPTGDSLPLLYGLTQNIKIIDVNIKSKFSKDILSKDSTGKATKYNLKADFEFSLNTGEVSRTIKMFEEFKIDNIEDNVEENNYIKIIKRNFAEIVSEKLILNINQNK